MSELVTPYQLLIADDHQLVVDGIKSLLSGDKKYKVIHEANNGQQAIELLNASAVPIDILLLDVSMPVLSGLEVCKIAKQQYADIKVLIVSMYNSTSVIKEALKVEADGYILKNTGKNELIVALDKIVDGGTYFSQDIIPILCNQLKKQNPQKDKAHKLSIREKEILALIVKEYTSDEIGEKLFISKKTVDKHRANILEKTNCKSTVGLVKYAIEEGIGA